MSNSLVRLQKDDLYLRRQEDNSQFLTTSYKIHMKQNIISMHAHSYAEYLKNQGIGKGIRMYTDTQIQRKV